MSPNSRGKEVCGVVLLACLRRVERILPVWALYQIAWSYAQFRSLLIWRPARRNQPDTPGVGATGPRHRNTARDHRNRVLEYLPDRLASMRWRKRCRIPGLDALREARRKGPVILVFSHFGPFYLTGFWLRAHGIPTTTLSARKSGDRSSAKLRKDRYLPFSHIPSIMSLDRLRDFVRLISAGTVVLVAIDIEEYGRLAEIPVDGRSLRIATGPIRLAAKYGAELFPCNIVDEGKWHFRIELGEPVPRVYLGCEPDLIAAGSHLITQLLPCCREHPDQLEAYSPLAALPGCTAQ
jgi:lauroyl/myristoyl acyltransferase